MSDEMRNEFEKAAAGGGNVGIFSEFWHFVRQTRKWWLAPTIIILLLVSLMLVLGGTAIAPFIYTLF
jgi:hypothetical protein